MFCCEVVDNQQFYSNWHGVYSYAFAVGYREKCDAFSRFYTRDSFGQLNSHKIISNNSGDMRFDSYVVSLSQSFELNSINTYFLQTADVEKCSVLTLLSYDNK